MKKLGFGLMRLPRIDADNPASIDIDTMKKMVDEFIGAGFTYFDTAWMYCGHESERAAKVAIIDRYPRDSFLFATKFHAAYAERPEDVERIFSTQLEKTGAGYFDSYLLHDMTAEYYEKCTALHAFEFFKKRRDEGVIRSLGMSFHDTPELLDRILTEHPEIESVQLQINYLDWENPDVRARECYETATRHGKPVLVMEPIRGGRLAKLPDEIEAEMKALHPDWSIASWAIRFCASLENVSVVLSGMSNLEQLRDNVSYMADFEPIGEAERAILAKAAAALNETPFIPCTSCAYCVEGCPMNIPIPKYFSLYNAARRGDESARAEYDSVASSFGAAGDCAECGQCEGMCPQHLRVIKSLGEVAEFFGK